MQQQQTQAGVADVRQSMQPQATAAEVDPHPAPQQCLQPSSTETQQHLSIAVTCCSNSDENNSNGSSDEVAVSNSTAAQNGSTCHVAPKGSTSHSAPTSGRSLHSGRTSSRSLGSRRVADCRGAAPPHAIAIRVSSSLLDDMESGWSSSHSLQVGSLTERRAHWLHHALSQLPQNKHSIHEH